MTEFKPRAFGRYTLLEHIAVGGMAEIFRAKLDGIGGFEKTLAIKRLHSHYSDDQQFVKMLIDEAKISALLQHANIVQIFDFGRVSGQYYIAMEYVAGRDLFQVLRSLHQEELQMPIATACFIVSEISQALHYAHCRTHPETGEALQVIHRDISPQNILLSWAGEVKIADFGIVKAARRATKTEAGIIKGKFYYMSPEQARGEDIDHRSDVFSAGIVLYEALTSTPLYDDDSESLLLERIQKGDVSSPRDLRSDIPEVLANICLKALAPDRADRYQTALELSRDLSEFLQAREHSFTKVDLGEFLKSLYTVRVDRPAIAEPLDGSDEEETLVDSEIPASMLASIEAAAQLQVDEDIQGATRDMRALTPKPSAAIDDMNKTSLDEIQVADLQVPFESTKQPETDDKATTAPVEQARDDSQNTLRSIAATDMLQAEQINRAHEKIKSLNDTTQPVPTNFTADVDPVQVQPSTSRRTGPAAQARVERIGRHLTIAIGIVLLSCMLVLATIVWVLTHPPELPPLTDTRASKESVKIVRSGMGTTGTARPRVSTKRPERAAVVKQSKKATIRIKRKRPNQTYKIYIDGELAEMENDELQIEAGQHTIHARLLPDDKLTPKRQFDVTAGAVQTLEL